jgi:hypothetical protein
MSALRDRLGLPTPGRPEPPKAPKPEPKPAWLARVKARDMTGALTR